jgi:hypothetical protein
MSDPGSLIPVSDEQAKAIQEGIKALRDFGGFAREIFGTIPEDIIGLLGGDKLRVLREENLRRITQKAKERLEAREVKVPEPVSLSVTLPILVAAADESREELQDLWARLLAAAADPARARNFRGRFIEVAKKMDPLDAGVLFGIQRWNGALPGGGANALAEELHVSRDQIDISCENLRKLELLIGTTVTPFGREFLRAVLD